MTYDLVVMIVDVGVDMTEEKKRRRENGISRNATILIDQRISPGPPSRTISDKDREQETDSLINPTDEERRVVVSEDQENFFILSFQIFRPLFWLHR